MEASLPYSLFSHSLLRFVFKLFICLCGLGGERLSAISLPDNSPDISNEWDRTRLTPEAGNSIQVCHIGEKPPFLIYCMASKNLHQQEAGVRNWSWVSNADTPIEGILTKHLSCQAKCSTPQPGIDRNLQLALIASCNLNSYTDFVF